MKELKNNLIRLILCFDLACNSKSEGHSEAMATGCRALQQQQMTQTWLSYIGKLLKELQVLKDLLLSSFNNPSHCFFSSGRSTGLSVESCHFFARLAHHFLPSHTFRILIANRRFEKTATHLAPQQSSLQKPFHSAKQLVWMLRRVSVDDDLMGIPSRPPPRRSRDT